MGKGRNITAPPLPIPFSHTAPPGAPLSLSSECFLGLEHSGCSCLGGATVPLAVCGEMPIFPLPSSCTFFLPTLCGVPTSPSLGPPPPIAFWGHFEPSTEGLPRPREGRSHTRHRPAGQPGHRGSPALPWLFQEPRLGSVLAEKAAVLTPGRGPIQVLTSAGRPGCGARLARACW